MQHLHHSPGSVAVPRREREVDFRLMCRLAPLVLREVNIEMLPNLGDRLGNGNRPHILQHKRETTPSSGVIQHLRQAVNVVRRAIVDFRFTTDG